MIPMAQFICITQLDRFTYFPAPSGTRYHSDQGKPFEVGGEADLAFFRHSPKRFKELGVVDQIKVATGIPLIPALKTVEQTLQDFLSGIKGLNKLSEEKILKSYLTLDDLKNDVRAGSDVQHQVGLTEKQMAFLKDAIVK
jgi:hypothetical protein